MFVFFLLLLPAMQVMGQKKALIIIDIQNFYFPGGHVPLEGAMEAATRASMILDQFRSEGEMVLHVRHNYSPGGEIHKLVSPEGKEPVISKDHVNSFRGTSLDSILVSEGIKEIVFCGMQTHMCLEAGVRAANDLGYKCTVVADACATRDLKYGEHTVSARDVHLSTLQTLRGSYASIVSSEEYLQSIEK